MALVDCKTFSFLVLWIGGVEKGTLYLSFGRASQQAFSQVWVSCLLQRWSLEIRTRDQGGNPGLLSSLIRLHISSILLTKLTFLRKRSHFLIHLGSQLTFQMFRFWLVRHFKLLQVGAVAGVTGILTESCPLQCRPKDHMWVVGGHYVNHEDYNDDVGNCDIIIYGSLSESDFVCVT